MSRAESTQNTGSAWFEAYARIIIAETESATCTPVRTGRVNYRGLESNSARTIEGEVDRNCGHHKYQRVYLGGAQRPMGWIRAHRQRREQQIGAALSSGASLTFSYNGEVRSETLHPVHSIRKFESSEIE